MNGGLVCLGQQASYQHHLGVPARLTRLPGIGDVSAGPLGSLEASVSPLILTHAIPRVWKLS